jgi:glutamate-5-semialdehyde dehydrogenase
MTEVQRIGVRARGASRALATTSTAVKDAGLRAIADALEADADAILDANNLDLERGIVDGLSQSLLDRLTLTPGRIADIAAAVRHVTTLRDPVGEVMTGWTLPNGLDITKVRVPLGVVGIIYEARPNVTVDAAALCLKSGNACILRGSRSAIESNKALVKILAAAATDAGLPPDAVQLVTDTDRSSVDELMKLREYVDVLIPRGGADLIRNVVEHATVPVIETGVGVCHVYVDAAADLSKAIPIIINAKVQRPSVCNAAESLLVHRNVAEELLPKAIEELLARGVEIRGDEAAQKISDKVVKATEEDYRTEFGDLVLAVKVVEDLGEAIDRINTYGTLHTDAIVTEDYEAARRFTHEVESAVVMVNASTRFSDGGEFGFGAEIGISNQKLHARGPMALPELTSYKYIVRGTGQVRS